MFGTVDLALFVVAGLLLNITPGPDTLYILGRTTAQGMRSGAVAARGIGAGLLVPTLAAAIGVSALIAASATAFTILKWLGAAYLVYVGIMLFFEQPSAPKPTPQLRDADLRAVFAQGFLTNVLNPKVALFFLAFLPQFVDSSQPNNSAAFLFLGCVFTCNGTIWNLLLAWAASRAARRFNGSRSFARWVNRCAGALLVYLGVRLVDAK